jgi:hypothetical protein
MEQVTKLETVVASWYRQLPFHLPEGGRKWLSENVWWIVIIGVVSSALGALGSLRVFMWANQSWMFDGITYYGARPSWTPILISLLFTVAVIVLEAMAISPLKNGKKRGWDLLFIAMLVSLLGAALSAVLLLDPFSLIGSVIGFAIGGFFLFEIHDRYAKIPTVKKVETPQNKA